MRIAAPLLFPPSPTQLQPFTTLLQSKAFKPHTTSLQLLLTTTLLQQTVIQRTWNNIYFATTNETTP
jgi:hypothetical protein